MRKLGLIFLMVFMVAALQVTPVQSWGPNTHIFLLRETMKKTQNAEAYDLYQDHPDAVNAGILFPDCTIIFYYLNFQEYRTTHSWSFLEKLWAKADSPRERAFAYGVAFHLIQDSISHNEYIPKKILELNIQNGIIHPLVEASVESGYVMPETPFALESIDEFLPLVEECLGRDYTREAHLLRDIIRTGGFYDQGYAPPEDDLKWKAYRWLLNFANMQIDSSDHDPYLVRAEDFSVAYAENRLPGAYDPSGAVALGVVDAELTFNSVLIYIVFGAAVMFVFWRSRRN